MRRQLITSSNRRFIGKNAEGYVLTSSNFKRIDNG